MIGWIIFGSIILILFLFFILPGFSIIGAREIGLLTRKNFGKKLPEGQIIALKGEVGIQADILTPGFYWRFPILWSIHKDDVTVINPDEVGLVKSIDGRILQNGRLLGDEVECDSFQDTKKFLQNGYRGPQVGFLKPGTYRINTNAFDVKPTKATEIKENEIGIAIALDGIPLPTGYIVAPRIKDEKGNEITDSKFYQNGQEFIKAGGYRGPQQDTLQPGIYYINTLLFDIKKYPIAEVAPGYVAVIRSNIGIELDKQLSEKPEDSTGEGKLSGPIHEAIENLLTLDKNKRGIWKEPVAPGKYNLNPLAYTPYLVPTSAVTIDWASEGKIGTEVKGTKEEGVLYKFNPLKVTSKDGFQLEVNVRMVIRIQPANAAFIIARFGSVANLIDQIVHPLIDSSFRNKAGEKKAIDFFQSRTDLQKEALEHAKERFAEYNVEAQNLLIAYIDIPTNLLDTQTKKEIANQQQTQFDAEALAQEKRIAVEEKNARANKQKDVIAAKLEIDIKTDLAKARKVEADGEAEYRQKTAAAEGLGLAEGLKAQSEAIDKEGTTIVNVIKELVNSKNPIVPSIYIGGNEGNPLGPLTGLLSAKFAEKLINKETKKEDKKEK